MFSSRTILALLYGLTVLIVVFTVLMAFFVLVSLLGDLAVARVLLWIGVGCLIFILSDLILLVGCLGINAVSHDTNRSDGPRHRDPDN